MKKNEVLIPRRYGVCSPLKKGLGVVGVSIGGTLEKHLQTSNFGVPAVCVFGGLDVHLWYFITSLACEHIKLHASNQHFVWHFFRCKSQQNIYSKLTQISQPATQTIFFP